MHLPDAADRRATKFGPRICLALACRRDYDFVSAVIISDIYAVIQVDRGLGFFVSVEGIYSRASIALNSL